MRSRSAHHAIKGYLYQLLSTIERILALQEGEEIEIEGIEDIDVHGLEGLDLIQCKYHEAQKFIPSLVHKPIDLMIADYMVNQDDPSSVIFISVVYIFLRGCKHEYTQKDTLNAT